ncbi:MAG: cobalt-precorrin-5B (C(1))-methyltransferase, partial [Nitriliruptoraceae bacterium]
MVLLGKPAPHAVDIRLLNGETWSIDIRECRISDCIAVCTVIKDAGDDPDATNKAEIGARVMHCNAGTGVTITGGEG